MDILDENTNFWFGDEEDDAETRKSMLSSEPKSTGEAFQHIHDWRVMERSKEIKYSTDRTGLFYCTSCLDMCRVTFEYNAGGKWKKNITMYSED